MYELIVSLDRMTQNFFEALRVPFLNSFFRVLTEMGNLVVLSFVVTVVVAYFLLRRRNEVAVALVGALVGATVTVALLKFGIGRARPDILNALSVEHFSSFPSLHAALSVAVYGTLARIAVGRMRTDASIFFTVMLCVILILLIGVSRLYLGVHYLSDVLGGYIVGSLWYLASAQYLMYRAPRWTRTRAVV